MNINIRLSKNFTTQYNKMQEKYGEEMAAINGFSDGQLSYTDFIDAFVDKETVADASIDGNANVGHKDIVTLMNEMPKPHQKLLAFNKIYHEMNKKYGFKRANEWLENEWNGHLYMHDANTTSFVHYCYKGEELLTIKYHNSLKVISFAELYNLVEEPEQFDITINQKAKFPIDLFVLDLDKYNDKTWTKITRIVKHTNNKPMRFIKYANGLSQIVTEDHPIITDDGDIPAKEVTTEHMVFTTPPLQYINKPKQKEWMTKEFGWLTGMCLAEASAAPSTVHLKQTETEQYEKIIYILNKFNMPFTEYGDHEIRFKVCEQEKFLEELLIGKTAAFKRLPSNFNEFPDEFLDGVVAGLIDDDGTIGGYKNRQCQIRIASEVLCHQISDYLKSKDVFCGDRTPYKCNSSKSFKQKLPMFGIAFTLTDENYFQSIDSIKITNKYIPRERQGDFKNKRYQYKYNWINITENTEYIDDCPIVYDITTETGHFICNNVLSHNCFAYDLKDLAEKGLYFIENFNAEPPKHLGTFIDFVKEFVSYACNRSSGAVGLPNLIPYMYYFWSRDVRDGYFTISPEKYAQQHIQRLIYALNQPFLRGGIQSAFTNTSAFDRNYLMALFGGAIFPDGELMVDEIEEIMSFQKIYLGTMSEIRSHNMMTFPVSTISLLKQNGEFQDKEFAEWSMRHNMKWNDSNIFIDDSVNSLSNCCRLKSNIEDLG